PICRSVSIHNNIATTAYSAFSPTPHQPQPPLCCTLAATALDLLSTVPYPFMPTAFPRWSSLLHPPAAINASHNHYPPLPTSFSPLLQSSPTATT
ncbi:hypothetical protein GW17_00053634, partial [Ensete ventricosum]